MENGRKCRKSRGKIGSSSERNRAPEPKSFGWLTISRYSRSARRLETHRLYTKGELEEIVRGGGSHLYMHVSQINLGANLDAGRKGRVVTGRPICMVISTGRSQRSNSSLSCPYYAVTPKKKKEKRETEVKEEERDDVTGEASRQDKQEKLKRGRDGGRRRENEQGNNRPRRKETHGYDPRFFFHFRSCVTRRRTPGRIIAPRTGGRRTIEEEKEEEKKQTGWKSGKRWWNEKRKRVKSRERMDGGKGWGYVGEGRERTSLGSLESIEESSESASPGQRLCHLIGYVEQFILFFPTLPRRRGGGWIGEGTRRVKREKEGRKERLGENHHPPPTTLRAHIDAIFQYRVKRSLARSFASLPSPISASTRLVSSRPVPVPVLPYPARLVSSRLVSSHGSRRSRSFALFSPGERENAGKGTKREKGGAKGEREEAGAKLAGLRWGREKSYPANVASNGERSEEVRWEPYVPPPVNWQYSCRAAYTASTGGRGWVAGGRGGWFGCTTDSHSPRAAPAKALT